MGSRSPDLDGIEVIRAIAVVVIHKEGEIIPGLFHVGPGMKQEIPVVAAAIEDMDLGRLAVRMVALDGINVDFPVSIKVPQCKGKDAMRVFKTGGYLRKKLLKVTFSV